MQKLSVKDLKLKANDIRQDIIKMLLEAKSGHSAGPLDMADIFAALYFNVMENNPKDPKWEGRDRLVLSCGHICPVLYAAMAEAGYFPKEELMTLRKLGTRLHGHPHNLELPGIETSSGPLSQGSSQAVGMALGLKMDKKPNYIYLIVSDGEQQEGQTWEAAMMAGKNHLDNLIAIMDRNRIQIDGNTEDIMPLDDLRKKYESFNWHVLEIDGNNMEEILKAFDAAKKIKGKPIMIIANTLAGKGVSFMEGDYHWHGMPPNKEQAAKALEELAAEREKLTD
jgi:transketolase